jgi:aspartate racemase
LGEAALQVEAAGADFLLICTNTMHKVAPQIESKIRIPLLHIADATADEIKKQGMTRIGLLGTIFTMEQEFYAGRLENKHGLKVLVPEKEDREIVNRVIYEELVLGIQKDGSREEYLRIMEDMLKKGAEGIIEGCTEIGMLVQQNHTNLPLFDTTEIHIQKAVELALE